MSRTTTIGEDDRSWAIYANAAGLLTFTNIPLANLIAALLVWLKVKNAPDMNFACEHAKASFNFQATWSLILFAAVAFGFGLIANHRGMVLVGLFPAMVVCYFLFVLLNVVFSIIGTARASDLKTFAYPFSITFLR